jgi:hypothetical protein
MDGEGEELLLREVCVAERFHALHVFGAGGKTEFAAALAVVEAAVKTDDSGVAAQLEVNGGVFRGGQARVEAGEVTDLVRVAPVLVMAPAGALDLEIDAYAIRV